MRRQRFVTALEHLAKDAIFRAQLLAHSPPLRAHSGEHEGELAAVPGAATPGERRTGLAGDRCVECVDGFVARGDDDGKSMLVVRAPMRRRGREIGQRSSVGVAKRSHVSARQLGKSLGAACAERNQCRLRTEDGGGVDRHDAWRLAHDHVCVRATESERVDARRRRTRRVGPWLERRHHAQMSALEIDVGIRRVEVQRRWQLSVLHAERGLDQARNPRRRFEVTEVRLHRADGAVFTFCPPLAQHGAECLRLERITNRCTGAMRLDVVHIRRRQACVGERLPQHRFLRDGTRHRHAVRAAVLVDRAADNDGIDLVAIGDGGGERLQYHHARPLAAHIPVRGRIERAALASGRDHRCLAEADRQLGVDLQLDTADDREIALPRLHAATRQMRCGERR